MYICILLSNLHVCNFDLINSVAVEEYESLNVPLEIKEISQFPGTEKH